MDIHSIKIVYSNGLNIKQYVLYAKLNMNFKMQKIIKMMSMGRILRIRMDPMMMKIMKILMLTIRIWNKVMFCGILVLNLMINRKIWDYGNNCIKIGCKINIIISETYNNPKTIYPTIAHLKNLAILSNNNKIHIDFTQKNKIKLLKIFNS